jgi:hypothetical protein
MIRIELSLRLGNSPGALAGVCRLLSDERINVQAMGLETGGQLRIVVDNHIHAAAVLRDHRPAQGYRGDRPELSAACVHTASYGTRSAMIVTVGATGRPRVRVADGPPCQAPFRDFSSLWAAGA